jgi:GNAT superfamily N-acetyltransferase
LAERARFAPHNPFRAHADVELFLAQEGGRTVGRIAAIDDRSHNERHGDNLAAFGHFEAETEAAAGALLSAAEEWARRRGRARMRGPVNSSLNETAGLLVDAFDLAPMVMMPYNPATYAGFIERAGYVKVKDLLAWIFDLPFDTPTRFTRVMSKLRGMRELTMRSVRMSAFQQEIDQFVGVYSQAWSENWGFVRPTREEVRELAFTLRYVVDRDLVVAAEMSGRMVGCAIALPDLNQVFRGTSGRLLPLALPRLLARKRIVTQVRLLLFGVLREWRGTGLAACLLIELLSRASRRYRRAELSWILEDNEAANGSVAALGARQYKTYRLYQKELA